MERTVKYSRQGEEWLCADREEALSIFLYELPNLTACNVFPPLHILNIVLLRGWAGGSMSPRFTWEPFGISEQEYQELLPKLLDPDWEVMCKKLWRIRLPMKHDSEFDDIADRYTWMDTACKKHGAKSLEEAAEEQRQFLKAHPGIMDKWHQYQMSQVSQHN
jgi:hypothetical protein